MAHEEGRAFFQVEAQREGHFLTDRPGGASRCRMPAHREASRCGAADVAAAVLVAGILLAAFSKPRLETAPQTAG